MAGRLAGRASGDRSSGLASERRALAPTDACVVAGAFKWKAVKRCRAAGPGMHAVSPTASDGRLAPSQAPGRLVVGAHLLRCCPSCPVVRQEMSPDGGPAGEPPEAASFRPAVAVETSTAIPCALCPALPAPKAWATNARWRQVSGLSGLRLT